MVTMDSLTGKNIILVEKMVNVGIDSIHIFRLDNLTNLYKLIGTIGMNDPGFFTDSNSIPEQQSYQYRIKVC